MEYLIAILPVVLVAWGLWELRVAQEPAPATRAELQAVVRRGRFVLFTILPFLGIGWVLYRRTEDAVVLVFSLLLLSQILAIRVLQRQGQFARPLFAGVLIPGYMAAFIMALNGGQLAEYGASVSMHWIAALAVAGSLAVVLSGGPGQNPLHASPRAAQLFGLVLLAPFLAGAVVVALGSQRHSREDLARYVEGFEEEPGELIRWGGVGRTLAWLQSTGDVEVDISRPAEVLRAAVHAGADLHPRTLNAGLRGGLFDRAALDVLAEGRDVERAQDLLEPGRRVHGIEYAAPGIRLLHATEELTPGQRENLVAAVAASWPDEPGIGRLGEMVEACELFELLGAPGEVQARRDSIHAALARSWVAEREAWWGHPGGFSAYDDGHRETSDHAATLHAVELMERVGVPPEVDLARVRAYLRRETESNLVNPLGRINFFNHVPSLALARFEAELAPLLQRSLAERLHDERLPLAALLAILYGLFALWRARPLRLAEAEPEPESGELRSSGSRPEARTAGS